MKNPANGKGAAGDFEAGAAEAGEACYVLRLYIAGTSPHSTRAIVNVRKICGEHLKGRCDLKIVDIAQSPALAEADEIIAAPTLVKKLPLPLRRFIGDMSQTEKILVGLNLIQAANQPG